MTRTAFIHDERMLRYDLGDDHPLSPIRRQLAIDLITAYGLTEAPGVYHVTPRAATDEEIERVHAPAYVKAVKRYSADPKADRYDLTTALLAYAKDRLFTRVSDADASARESALEERFMAELQELAELYSADLVGAGEDGERG